MILVPYSKKDRALRVFCYQPNNQPNSYTIPVIVPFGSNEKEDEEELAAGIVHEMFHSFQQETGEMRYPNNLEILDYQLNAGNFTIKYMENILLAKAYMTSKIQQKL